MGGPLFGRTVWLELPPLLARLCFTASAALDWLPSSHSNTQNHHRLVFSRRLDASSGDDARHLGRFSSGPRQAGDPLIHLTQEGTNRGCSW